MPTGQLILSLRALGIWITLVHLPATLFAAPTGLAIYNNQFTPDQWDLVLRLGTSLGITATVLAMATLLNARRPPWAWSRSLPWSARQRVAADAGLLLMVASPLLIPTGGDERSQPAPTWPSFPRNPMSFRSQPFARSSASSAV